MPVRVVYTGEGSGFAQYGTTGKKYRFGPGEEYESRKGAEEAADKQAVAINLDKERRGEEADW